MATLQQIREVVSRKVQDPDFTEFSPAVVDAEINRSIRYYENERFWFNDTAVQITLNASSGVVPNLPTDLIAETQVNGLTLIDSQIFIPMIKLLPDQYDFRNDESIGRPEFYTYRGQGFEILPYPDRAYTLRLRYTKKYPDLVNDSDTNDFTEHAEDLIMLHTVKNLYAEDKEDNAALQRYIALEKIEYDTIKRRSNNLNASGYVYAESILDNTYYY